MTTEKKDTLNSGLQILITKLGHPLEEIRIRSLQNISSKIEYGIITEKDLIADNQMLSHLFNWFNFSFQPEKTTVLKLISKLANTSLGKDALIKFDGVIFFTTLKKNIETKHHRLIDEILELLCVSADSNNALTSIQANEEPVFTNEVQIYYNLNEITPACEANEVDCVSEKFFKSSISNNAHFGATGTYFEETAPSFLNTIPQNGFYFTTFPWIPLNSSDRHVLVSTNDSLMNNDAKELGNLCKFLRGILFQDFPAEIFLERPQIFFSLLKLIQKDDDKLDISTESVRCLLILVSKLKARIRFYSDPTLGHSRKSSALVSTISTSRLSSPDSRILATRHSTTPDQLSEFENDLIEEDLLQLQLMQITVPEFCLQILKTCLPLCQEIRCEILTHIVQLMHSAADVLEMIFSSSFDERVCEDLGACFSLLDCLLQHHQLKLFTSSDERNIQLHRLTYLCIANIAIRMLKSTIEPAQVKQRRICHPLIDSLASLLFDPSFYLCYPQFHSVLLGYINEKRNDLVQIYEQTLQICESMKYTNMFLKQIEDIRNANEKQIIYLAESSLISLSYHKHPEFIQRFVDFLADRSIKYSNDVENDTLENGKIILIKLIKHGSQVIRLITFRTCHDLVKQTVKTGIKNTSSLDFRRIQFLFDHRIIRTFFEFGFYDENTQISEMSKDIITSLLQSRLPMGNELWIQLLNSVSLNFSIIQAFADSTSSLGRAISFLTDIETSSLPQLELLRGLMRLMYTCDHQLRYNTLANLAWFLTSEHNSKLKLPSVVEAVLSDKPNLFIPSSELKYIAFKKHVTTFELGSLKNVLAIASAADMETEIKKSAIGQLPSILEDFRLHNYFIENGLDCLLKIIESSLLKEKNMMEVLPVCFHSLMILVVNNPDLRQTLSDNDKIYLQLLRGALLYYNEVKIHLHICVILSLLLFKDDLLEIERIPPVEGGDAVIERVFSVSLPIFNRYKLPIKVTELSVDVEMEMYYSEETHLYACDNAKRMLKIFWNIHLNKGISNFIQQQSLDTNNNFSSILNASSVDQQIVIATNLRLLFEKALDDINVARSHRQVRQSLVYLRLLILTSYSNDCSKEIASLAWQDSFAKFITVFPISNADKRLLRVIIDFFVFLLTGNYTALSEDFENWLISNLFTSTSAVHFSLSNQTVDIDSDSRLLNSKLIRFVSVVMKKCQIKLTNHYKIGDIVLFVLQALSVSEAAQFYNLASLEAVIRCLMHLTFRPGWSTTCSKLSDVELCEQVLSALMDVIIAFHVGLGKSNHSLMGKGVTLAAAVSLQHLISEMKIRFEDEKWVELWLSQKKKPTSNSHVLGLKWLVPLWIYRDEEVRSASLCIAVGLSENATGCLTLMTNLEDISGGIWGAAFSFLLDSIEVTCVKEQAALLLVNLTRHLITDGNNNLIAQNLTVKDSSTNELLIGVDALRALLHLSNFFENVVYLISCYVHQQLMIRSQLPQCSNVNERFSVSDLSFENISLHSPGTESSNLETLTENSESSHVASLITPTLIRNLGKLIQNLLLLVPNETLAILNSQMLELFISSLDRRSIIYSLKRSSLLYAMDLLKMHSRVLALVSVCVVKVKNPPLGLQISKNFKFIQTLVDLLENQFVDDRYRVKEDVYQLWSEIYKLFWLLLTMESPHSTVVNYLSRHCTRVIANMILILENCKDEEPWLNCLKFFSAYYKIGENISNYLDASSDNLCETNKDVTTVGAFFCHLLLRKYEELVSIPKQDFMTCGIVLNALSSVLSSSNTAKAIALKRELIRREIEHLKDIYVSITLASLDNRKLSTTKKIEAQCQQSLILHFDLLQCFLHNCQDAKTESSQHGLSGILHQLWCWCLETPLVLLSLLSLLCTYTANCKTSIRSVAYTSAGQGAGTVKTLGVHSLVHALIRLAQNENDRLNNTKDAAILTLVFQTLTNACLGSECRSIVCKTNFLDGFTKLNVQQTKKFKHQIHIDSMWLHFLLSLTFHSDGQDVVIRMPGAVDLLVEFVGTGSGVSVAACRVLRNLCCSSPANKSLLLNSDRVLRAVIAFLKNESKEKSIAASALWALTANCQKAKSMLRNVSLIAQLQQICLECDNSEDSILTSQHLQQVLDLCQIETSKTLSHVGLTVS
uniref:Rotatin N-terminal domain-containing protein n=1 Tax=Strigamia maritima TaxID=126957 RepID=T1J497_STRMM